MKNVFWFVVGFAAYPMLFVPLMLKYTPEALGVWIGMYADYLKLWGV